MSVTNSSAPQWDALPQNLWTIWLTGYESAPITNKVSFAVMKSRFEKKGFKVHLVDLQNANQYLGQETMTELHRIVDNKKYPRHIPTMSDLLRLALLNRHGGVYMDMSVVVTGDIDWITNIARLPSHLFMNRFSPMPKVVMSFSCALPKAGFWTIKEERGVKQEWLHDYENSFIIAEKGTEFLVEAQRKFMEMLESPWSKIHAYMVESGVDGHPLIQENGTYLLQMQMMNCLLGSKQKEIATDSHSQWVNSAHYYSFWSFYGIYGPSKFWREWGHLDDIGTNATSYQTLHSRQFVDGLVGELVIPVYKVLGDETREFTQLFEEYSRNN